MFLVDYRDNISWMSDLASKISSGELAKSVQDAQALLDLHKERKVSHLFYFWLHFNTD